jgi:hypothetical protein
MTEMHSGFRVDGRWILETSTFLAGIPDIGTTVYCFFDVWRQVGANPNEPAIPRFASVFYNLHA